MKMIAGAALAAIALSLACAGLAEAQTPAAAPDAVRGETLYKQRCALCHSLVVDTTRRPGPSLKAVIGRKPGTVAGFNYSASMKALTAPWSTATLDAYLAAPGKTVPGGFMVLSVPNARDRADIVAYMAGLTR
jgi:cytochrome c